MGRNRQISSEFKTITFTSGEFVDPDGRAFLVRCEGAGDVVIQNPKDDASELFTVFTSTTLEFYTKKVIEAGTTVSSLKAVFS